MEDERKRARKKRIRIYNQKRPKYSSHKNGMSFTNIVRIVLICQHSQIVISEKYMLRSLLNYVLEFNSFFFMAKRFASNFLCLFIFLPNLYLM